MIVFKNVLSQLVKSRQKMDTLKKDVEARSRENFLLRQQLQKLTDCAGGLTVDAQRLELGGAEHCLEVVGEDSQGESGCGGRVQGV